jgi:carboxypeptidase PM20D1
MGELSMKLAGKVMSGVALAVIATGAVILWRAQNFSPAGTADLSGIKLAAIPDYDVQSAARNLSQAIRFQTVSHQNKAENQIAEWEKFQGWLKTAYPSANAVMTREIAGERALIYKWPGSAPDLPPIILMAHQDVVPITPGTEKDWTHPPFAGEIAENAVWGRGAVDDKGSLIGLFEALEGLAKQGFRPKRTIYLVSGHDEEAGGTGAKAAADLLASRGVKALFTIDEGSAVIEDAPLINAPAILIGIAEKGYGTIKVTANAQGGHSSMPPKETGVVNLAKAVIAISDHPFPLEMRGPGADMLGSLAARKGGMTKVMMANGWLFGGVLARKASETPSGAAMLHTTIAPTMLEGSPKENVLPQTATALINYRIAPWNMSADVMAKAKAAVGSQPVTLSWVKPPREPSRVSSTESQGWKLIAAVAQGDAPKAALTPYLVVAGTDSRSFEGVSQDVYRFMPLHFQVKETAMIHGTNEHMTLDNLQRMINFYARLIATSAG